MNRAQREFGENKIIICPKCENISPTSGWIDSFVFCEDCGEHSAVKCPFCDEDFDSVWGYEKIKVQ